MLKQQPEISLKLFLDCHDKAHSSMNNTWISAAGVIHCAFSYCNTLTGLVRLASSLRVVTGYALRGWPKGRGMELFWWNWTTIGWEAGQKLCVNTLRIYRQPLGMRLLFCVHEFPDRTTLLPVTFCHLIPIMSPWTGVEREKGSGVTELSVCI